MLLVDRIAGGVNQSLGLPKCRCRSLAAHMQEAVVRIVFDGQQPAEVTCHDVSRSGNLAQ
ncbi:MAG: hypothetical protein ACRDT2_16890 [Natronosporangium sp.]